jgi:hypothetical protein
MTQQGTDNFTLVASVNIPQKRAVSWTGAIAGAGASVAGVSDHSATIGEPVRTRACTADIEAGAAIDPAALTDMKLTTDANGRAIPWTTGASTLRLINKPGNRATALGDLVEVVVVWTTT